MKFGSDEHMMSPTNAVAFISSRSDKREIRLTWFKLI